MAVHEAGQNQLSAGVDHPRLRPTQFFDFRVITYSDDFFATNCYSLCPCLFGVHGIYLAVDKDGVRGLRFRVLRSGHGSGSQKNENGTRQHDGGFAQHSHSHVPI